MLLFARKKRIFCCDALQQLTAAYPPDSFRGRRVNPHKISSYTFPRKYSALLLWNSNVELVTVYFEVTDLRLSNVNLVMGLVGGGRPFIALNTVCARGIHRL